MWLSFFRLREQLIKGQLCYFVVLHIMVKGVLFYGLFRLFPLTMLIAQYPDQFFPCWRSCKAWFLLARIHFEQQCGAIQVAGIAGGSDYICREGCFAAIRSAVSLA